MPYACSFFHGVHILESQDDNQKENMDEPDEVTQQETQEELIGQCIMPLLKPTRKQKFSWSEEADR